MSRFAVLAMAIIAAVFICQTAAQDPQCPPNEVWGLCGRSCEPNCATTALCGASCAVGTPGACRCQSGYVRNSKDQCVLRQEC